MPLPATAKIAFDLKSTAWTLTALRLQTADLDQLLAALDARFGDSPGLFDNDPVVIDLSLLREADAALDLAGLLPHLHRLGMLPIAVQGASPAQAAAARAAGLVEAPAVAPKAAAAPASGAVATPASAPSAPLASSQQQVLPMMSEVIREVEGARAVARDVVPDVPSSAVPTLVVDKPLRSGQRVYARGGDLVVLAAVSVGAEVIADGNIHVYGPLRGRAIAGARGNTEARIFSTCLEPQLVSIAGIYRTTETPLPANVLGQPAQVRLAGEKILVEPLAS